MADSSSKKRIDSASRMIKASPQTIYWAFINPEALVSWLPPEGMSGQIDTFDAREGGTYRMVLAYNETNHANLGKSSEGTEVTIVCEDVPEGIRQEDHEAGLNSTLENLAVFTE